MKDTPEIIVPHRSVAALSGRVEIYVQDRSGLWKPHEADSNIITLDGRNAVRDAVNGSGFDLDYMAVGTDGTAESSSDSALGAEVARELFTTETTNAAEKVYRLTLGSADANGNTLREAGLFDAASGGTLFARFTYSDIVKDQNTAVQYNWTVTISDV